MKMHQVEVDDEVFLFVKTHAEPLVDTFNSALRRLLPLSHAKIQTKELEVGRAGSASILPSLSSGIPQALRQILEVIHLTLGGAYTRTTATKCVARYHKVYHQTVYDKYCRQLNLTVAEFDRLLGQIGLEDLKKILKSKFPNHAQIIDEVVRR